MFFLHGHINAEATSDILDMKLKITLNYELGSLKACFPVNPPQKD